VWVVSDKTCPYCRSNSISGFCSQCKQTPCCRAFVWNGLENEKTWRSRPESIISMPQRSRGYPALPAGRCPRQLAGLTEFSRYSRRRMFRYSSIQRELFGLRFGLARLHRIGPPAEGSEVDLAKAWTDPWTVGRDHSAAVYAHWNWVIFAGLLKAVVIEQSMLPLPRDGPKEA
jgi:hypothetical protein